MVDFLLIYVKIGKKTLPSEQEKKKRLTNNIWLISFFIFRLYLTFLNIPLNNILAYINMKIIDRIRRKI